MMPSSTSQSPKVPLRRTTTFSGSGDAPIRSSHSISGRTASYRSPSDPVTSAIDLLMERSSAMPLRRGSTQLDIIDRKDLSPSEETNLVRLFLTFATDVVSESEDDAQSNATYGKVLEMADFRSLLTCLGIKMTDELWDKIKHDVQTRIPGEIQFDEFVTYMVRSQELRTLMEEIEQTERDHVLNYTRGWRFESDATWRWFWDVVILLITGYFGIMVSYEWVFPNPMTSGWWALESVFNAILMLDIFVYANTTTKDADGRAVDDLKEVVLLYLKSTFAADFLGALPIDLFISFAMPDTHHLHYSWFVFRGMNLLRFVRVVVTLFSGFSVHGFLRPTFVYLHYTIAPVLKALFYFCTIVHYLSIGWLVVKIHTDSDELVYIDAIYIVLYTLSTCGYGDMEIKAGAQRVYCCFLFLGGVIMNGLVISQMSVFLQKADIQNDRKDKMRETLAVLRHFDIPDDTQSEILSFQHHILSHNLGSSHEELMGSLPTTIQESLGLFMRIKFIAMVPMFASSPADCKQALATILVNKVFHPHEFIIVAGEIGQEMYFLGHGAADVIGPQGQHFATLRKGNFFGEIALLVDGATRNASIKALTYCDTFRLEKADFERIMHKYPHFRRILEAEVAERVQQFKNSQKNAAPKIRKVLRRQKEAFGAASDVVSGDEAPEMPTFDDVQMEQSINPARGRQRAGRPPHAPHDSPRGRAGPGRVNFSNFNALAGGRAGEEDRFHRRASFTAGLGSISPGQADSLAILTQLAERVAMLERRASNTHNASYTSTGNMPPLIPPAYSMANGLRLSNAGKSKTEVPTPGSVPTYLADYVSSDDELSARHTPYSRQLGATVAGGSDLAFEPSTSLQGEDQMNLISVRSR